VPDTRAGQYLTGARLAMAGGELTVADLFGRHETLYRRFWEPLAVAALNTAPEEAAAKLLWPVMKETLGKGEAASRPCIARTGLSDSFVKPALAFLEAAGVSVAFNRRLRDIGFEGARVASLSFGKETIDIGPRDRVVLAVTPGVAGNYRLLGVGRNGGWPLNVWVTPDRKPFFAGTYFPPSDSRGRPGFKRVLASIREQFEADPARLADIADQLAEQVRESLEAANATSSQVAGAAALREANRAYQARADRRWGGIGRRTKFPSSLPARMLLRFHRRSGDPAALELVELSLEKMAAGGIHDQIGGGFHRYTTEPRWLVPHFEKMLYDNALLASAYLEAAQVTGREDFRAVARSVLDYVMREMSSPEGAFYSATDADSAGPEGEMEEGLFFTWTPAEIRAALDPDAAAAAIAFWGVTEQGNFEGRNILHAWRPADLVAAQLEIEPAELQRRLERARAGLYAARARRPAPLRDEKILVAWNGLMISAFARAGFAFDEPRYTEAARRAARFILGQMRERGRLLRVSKDGRAAGPAFLEDYAFLIAALLDLYEADPDPTWLREAIALQAVLDRDYADAAGGGYFKTANSHEPLLAREKPARDGAIPAGNSVAALNLLRLAEFTGRDDYLASATLLFSAFHDTLVRSPTALAEMLIALDYHLDEPKEVVVVRPASDGEGAAALMAPLRGAFVPNRIVSVVREGAELDAHAALVPLLSGKRALQGRPTAYVCVNRVCGYPTPDPAVLAEQLARTKPLEKGEEPTK